MRRDIYKKPRGSRYVRVTDRDNRRADPKAIKDGAPPPPVMVDRFTQCHVTPHAVAARMAAALGDVTGPILEPSAGTGNLIAALIGAGFSPGDIVAIEKHGGLATVCADRFDGVTVHCDDFLADDEGARFGAVLINPPFSAVRAHIKHAISALRPGGVMVALVPVTFDHEDAEELETLPPDTFAAARVHTKIIRIEKAKP